MGNHQTKKILEEVQDNYSLKYHLVMEVQRLEEEKAQIEQENKKLTNQYTQDIDTLMRTKEQMEEENRKIQHIYDEEKKLMIQQTHLEIEKQEILKKQKELDQQEHELEQQQKELEQQQKELRKEKQTIDSTIKFKERITEETLYVYCRDGERLVRECQLYIPKTHFLEYLSLYEKEDFIRIPEIYVDSLDKILQLEDEETDVVLTKRNFLDFKKVKYHPNLDQINKEESTTFMKLYTEENNLYTRIYYNNEHIGTIPYIGTNEITVTEEFCRYIFYKLYDKSSQSKDLEEYIKEYNLCSYYSWDDCEKCDRIWKSIEYRIHQIRKYNLFEKEEAISYLKRRNEKIVEIRKKNKEFVNYLLINDIKKEHYSHLKLSSQVLNKSGNIVIYMSTTLSHFPLYQFVWNIQKLDFLCWEQVYIETE